MPSFYFGFFSVDDNLVRYTVSLIGTLLCMPSVSRDIDLTHEVYVAMALVKFCRIFLCSCSLFLCRSQSKDVSSLAKLKVTDCLYDITFPCQCFLHKGLSISVNVLAVAADSLIAAILCTLLKYSRSGFWKWSHLFSYDLPISIWRIFYLLRSDAIINKLVCTTFVSSAVSFLSGLHVITKNLFSDYLHGQYGFTHQVSTNFAV